MSSIESNVFRKHQHAMAQEIKHSLSMLVGDFYSRGFIDANEQEVLHKRVCRATTEHLNYCGIYTVKLRASRVYLMKSWKS